MSRGLAATTPEEYLAAAPADQALALRTVLGRLLDALPGAQTVISYGIIVVRVDGRAFVGLSAARTHCSLHLMSTVAAASLAEVLPEGRLVGATVHFSADAPLGPATVRTIVEARRHVLG